MTVSQSVSQAVGQSVCVPVCLCLSDCLSVSVCVSPYVCVPVSVSICLSLNQPVCQTIILKIEQSLFLSPQPLVSRPLLKISPDLIECQVGSPSIDQRVISLHSINEKLCVQGQYMISYQTLVTNTIKNLQTGQ